MNRIPIGDGENQDGGNRERPNGINMNKIPVPEGPPREQRERHGIS